MSKSLTLGLVVVLILAGLPLLAAAQPATNIEPELLARFEVEGTASFFVKMAVEADLSAAYAMDWSARGRYVVEALMEVAQATQGPVIGYAERHGLAYRSYLINNSVEILAGGLEAARALAALPGVAYLRAERILSLPDPVDASAEGAGAGSPSPRAAMAWGITDTKADQVWALGVRGGGIKVANIDTGVQWNHPALVNQFACPGDPTNPACWRDPSNVCRGSACDNNGHGTHTMGTMVAKDDPTLPYIAGMAPDATWIACKGCESNSCSESALTACADWILWPGRDPDNRPHIVNNSWGGEGGGQDWYQSYVQAWRAAGIFPAFSAGNSGPGCSTLGSPGDYQESFASAAHQQIGRRIASFSSRGPSAFGHDPYTKPNISAPGVSICSTVPTDRWNCGYSGTSMASPHTAGAVALLWSSCPNCVGQIEATFQILQGSADPPLDGNCGAPPDGEGNYTYGYGYLNALAAVQAIVPPVTPTLEAIANDDGDNNYLVKWSDVPAATGYRLQEAESAAFEVTATVYEGAATQFSVEGHPGGLWYYRVVAFGLGGDSPPSNVEQVGVRPLAPFLYHINNRDGDGDYLIEWAAAGAIAYHLEEDDNRSFDSPLMLYEGPDTSFAVTGQGAGTWFYRVRAANDWGVSPWGGPQMAIVGLVHVAHLPLVLRDTAPGP